MFRHKNPGTLYTEEPEFLWSQSSEKLCLRSLIAFFRGYLFVWVPPSADWGSQIGVPRPKVYIRLSSRRLPAFGRSSRNLPFTLIWNCIYYTYLGLSPSSCFHCVCFRFMNSTERMLRWRINRIKFQWYIPCIDYIVPCTSRYHDGIIIINFCFKIQLIFPVMFFIKKILSDHALSGCVPLPKLIIL